MAVTEVLDISDLATNDDLWIYGAGPRGEEIASHLKHLPSLRICGFFDTSKNGDFLGLPMIHPGSFEGPKQATKVIIATPAADAVVPLLGSLGFANIYHVDQLIEAIASEETLHYLPGALPEGKPAKPISAMEARVRAAGARLLIHDRQLELGFRKLRELALESGYIFVQDNVAGCAFRHSGDQPSLVRFYDEAVRQEILPGAELAKQQQRAIARGLPPVFINTMLKSGTGFLTKVLAEHLDLPQFFTTLGGSPNDWAIPAYVAKLAEGGALTVQHLDASAENLDILAAAGVKKIYLHLRDPRQSTVSYMHHLENNLVNDLYPLRNWIQPFLPADYCQRTWQGKVDWHAKNHVVGQIHWVQEWLTATASDPRFDILIKDFNAFRKDEVGTVNEVLGFFEIDHRVTASDMPPKHEVPHFRSGQAEEWRKVFSPRQQKIHWALIPDAMAARFGWRE